MFPKSKKNIDNRAPRSNSQMTHQEGVLFRRPKGKLKGGVLLGRVPKELFGVWWSKRWCVIWEGVYEAMGPGGVQSVPLAAHSL